MDGSFLEAPVYRYLKCNWRSSSFSRPNCKGQVRSCQVVILKARPAMDAAVMSFHLSLSPTSFSSLSRFRPVAMPYNDKLALFRSFSILSIHSCFGRPTGRFSFGFQLWTMDGHLSLFIMEICPYHFILIFRTVFSDNFLPCPYSHLRIAAYCLFCFACICLLKCFIIMLLS